MTTSTTAELLLTDLLDEGSLHRIRTQVRSPAMERGPAGDGVICGTATVDGVTVACFEQDTSVLGGSLGQAHADSICRLLDVAKRRKLPVIGVHRSGGARIQEGVASLAGYARIFARHVALRGVVPQIGLITGPCAGGAAYGPALMDFVLMPSTGAYLFLTGPEVVRQVTGEVLNFEELGGSQVHGRSGLACLVDDDPLSVTRRLLSFFTPLSDGFAPANADPGKYVPSDPRKSYDVRNVIADIVDAEPLLELHALWAPNLVVGFARLNGKTVGVIANQPQSLAGTLDASAARKGAWFVNLCNRFHIPIVAFVDTPGFLPGRSQELTGVIPAGAAFLSAFAQASVPKLTVVLRKAYGGAFIVMNARDLGADLALAWPSAEIAVMGARGAVSVLHRKKLAAHEPHETQAVRDQLEAEYTDIYCTPWRAAEGGYIDEVIEPNQTRARLISALS